MLTRTSSEINHIFRFASVSLDLRVPDGAQGKARQEVRMSLTG
ncbi:MAG TPA: hypothetical protein VIU64_19150 [Polyangia bacterium]